MKFDLVIKNALIVNHNGTKRADIGVKGEKIEKIGTITESAKVEIPGEGRIVFPGIIDPHTHMGIPMMDTFSVDNFKTGSYAAAHAGVTTIIDFTVQNPGDTLITSFERRKHEARISHVDFALHVNITEFYDGFLDDMEKVAEKGARSFKVFFAYSFKIPDELFLRVQERTKEINALTLLHAENGAIIDYLIKRNIERGHTSPPYHGISRPVFTEEDAVQRAILITEYAKSFLYIVHMTSKRGLMRVEEAKKRKVRVFAETCPQYLYFTDDAYRRPDGHYFIASPPLRKKEDVEYLWEKIKDGTMDTIGTDHAPFTKEQKDRYGGIFYKTPNGLSVIEFSMPSIFTKVIEKKLSITTIARLMSYNPAKIFGLEGKGEIKEGADADLVIVDPSYKKKVAPPYKSVSDISPFEGLTLRGIPEFVILRGKFLIKEYLFVGHDVKGKYLEQKIGFN